MEIKNITEKAGIYKLTCIINGKIYIGKSYNIRQRLYRHRLDGRKLKSDNYFYRAVAKHGWDNFVIEVMETFDNFDKNKDSPMLLEKEASYIRAFKSNDENIGYNVCEYSTDRTGMKNSIETRKKISIANLGRKLSDETKAKISNARKGMKLSEETREKMRNRRFSDETRKKISIATKGKKISEETKAKISNARKGMKFSEETREKMSIASKGRKHSEEAKKKIGLASKGRKHSEQK